MIFQSIFVIITVLEFYQITRRPAMKKYLYSIQKQLPQITILFILAIFLHSIPLLFKTAGYGTLMIPVATSIYQIILYSVSALTMYYFLYTEFHDNDIPVIFIFLFSLSYSMSSCVVIQSSDSAFLVLVCLFPILISSYKKMLLHNKTILFVIILSLCFIFQPVITLTICILLFFYTLISINPSPYARHAQCLHYVLSALFSFFLSAFTALPRLVEYFNYANVFSYSGFQQLLPAGAFFSRFLFGSVSSTIFEGLRGINLYFGGFAFTCFILYFFNSSIPVRERINTLCITVMSLCILEFSSLQYIVEGFSTLNSIYIYYTFIFIFYFIYIASKCIPHLNKLKPTDLIFTGLFIITILVFSFVCNKNNFHPLALNTGIFFIICYFVLLCLFKQRGNNPLLLRIVLILTVFELAFNFLLLSYKEFLPDNCGSVHGFDWSWVYTSDTTDAFSDSADDISDISKNETIAQTEEIELDKDVSDFITNHRANNEMILIEKLQKIAVSSDLAADSSGYTKNYFEKANEACHSLGIEKDLFSIVNDVSYSFEEGNSYSITPEGHDLFYIESLSTPYDTDIVAAKFNMFCSANNVYITTDSTTAIYKFGDIKSNSGGYFLLPISRQVGCNFKIFCYSLNPDVYQAIEKIVQNDSVNTSDSINMTLYYIGTVLSLTGIFLLLLFIINRKATLKSYLLDKKTKFSHLGIFHTINNYIRNNKVYFLSFFIPIGIYILTFIVFNIYPFGSNTLLAGDGLLSVYAGYHDALAQFQSGNISFSQTAAYGYSFAPWSPITLLMMLFIPADFLFEWIHISMVFSYGLISLCTVFYLTHRLAGPRADKKDIKLIIPGLIYSMSSYMLVMHGYFNWYYSFMLLPLLILAFERLVYKKKWELYVLLLSFLMCNDIQIAYHVCILLALLFILSKFDNIKDFIKRGILFASASILSAVNSFLYLSTMFLSRSGSGYEKQDSILPHFGLFGSFFAEWKQHLIFSFVNPVSKADNSISLYASILIVFILILYMIAKQFSLKEKLRRLIPIILLYLSFNEQVLTYVVNGFHYQSNVPNRHVYILMFLLAILTYDTIFQLYENWQRISTLVAAFLTVLLFLCCYIFGGNVKPISLFVSLVFIIIYCTILLMPKHFKVSKTHILIGLIISEFSVNSLFLTANYGLADYSVIGNQSAMTSYTHALTMEDNEHYATFPASQIVNNGMIFQIKTNDGFIPFMPNEKINYQILYGGFCGTNYISNTHGSTYANNALFAVRYIFIPRFATNSITDLYRYDYLGSINNYYVFENKDAGPLGYFASSSIKDVKADKYNINTLNTYVKTLLQSDENLYHINYFANSELNDTQYGSYCFYTKKEKTISVNDVFDLSTNNTSTELLSREYYTEFTLPAKENGMAYLYANELIPLGQIKKDHTYHFSVLGLKLIEPNYYQYCTINDNVYYQLTNYLKNNKINNFKTHNNKISFDVDYPETGFTFMNMAYNDGWNVYIDGKETSIQSFNNAALLIPTPSGKHHIEMIYDSLNIPAAIVSIAGWSVTIFLLLASLIRKRAVSKKK